jgi:DNA-binding transcriptional LysR family regulator
MNSLRFFDSAARHLNLSLAADELHVSHSAVSQQIRQLETWLGCKLFERHSDGVRLTVAGQDLRRACQPAFDRLEQRCAELRGKTASTDVVIGAPASLLSNWLIPRLEHFEREHPEVQVRLQTATDIALLERRVIDVLIVAEDHKSPGIDAMPLFPEAIGPVCTPDLAKRITTPADVLNSPLLHTSSRPAAWEQWATACGLEPAQTRPKRQFDQLSHMLEAAAVGLGIGIAPEILVQADIRGGRLVAPLGFKETGGRFDLYFRTDTSTTVEDLKLWLKAETASDARQAAS